MVDLVDKEMGDENYAFKTWFDPAVGTGNFPAEILERKLEWCKSHKLSEGEMLRALSSIYAVDIQEDNVLETRDRLFRIFRKYMGCGDDYPILQSLAKEILKANIILGDTINESEKIVFLKYEKIGFPFAVTEHKLSDMLGKDYMKDLEKRRKARTKKQQKNASK